MASPATPSKRRAPSQSPAIPLALEGSSVEGVLKEKNKQPTSENILKEAFREFGWDADEALQSVVGLALILVCAAIVALPVCVLLICGEYLAWRNERRRMRTWKMKYGK